MTKKKWDSLHAQYAAAGSETITAPRNAADTYTPPDVNTSMARLADYGYQETDATRTRRQSLGRAVQAIGYQRVYNALSSRMSRRNGYRFRRLRADRNWVAEKMIKTGRL